MNIRFGFLVTACAAAAIAAAQAQQAPTYS